MMTPLGETAPNSPRHERRTLRRLAPVAGVITARITAPDGNTLDASVGDVTAAGARLLGDLPLNIGDHVRLSLDLDSTAAPYITDAIVTHRSTTAVGTRFKTR